jgi:oligopeptide transport system substrate-binding protein
MKKLLVLLLSLLMAITLVACGQKEEPAPAPAPEGGEEEAAPTYESTVSIDDLKLADTKTYVAADTSEIANMDYVTTALATDHEINVNFVDGLVECDKYGNYVGSIAESWEPNEDATVWTFHLRKGVNWVTNTGEVYDEVKAEDFVTGLRHSAEFQSGTASVVAPYVAGYDEYYNTGDWSDEAWAKVGVKAVDDYTVEYTMAEQFDLNTGESIGATVTYFPTICEYTILYPINRAFLESKGDGCKLGSPDITACTFGQVAPDSILYNGAYILDSFDVKSQTVLKKNNAYWDAANVDLETIKIIYDDGSDVFSTLRGFEQNTYVAAGLSSAMGDEAYKKLYSKYENYITASMPNAYAFGVVFNYNRVKHDLTNYATDEAMAANTHNAINNENFRLALKSAFDVPAYLAVRSPELVAEGTIRNINSFPTLVSTSDGTPYVNLIEDAYAELNGGTKVNLQDGQWPWLSKEKALAYIEAAKADGIEFPVHLDMLVIETSVALVNQAQSMKQSIEENTDGQIIIELVMKDSDTVQNVAYYTTDWADADYDISTFTGWGPDYMDPRTFVDIYSPVVGYYMHSCGLTDTVFAPDEFGSDDAIKEAVGFNEYEKIWRAADAIKSDLDARYKEFAKADAYLLYHGLYIPTSMQTRAVRITHVVPFSAIYSTGVSQYKYKGTKLQEGIVTVEEYNQLKADWEANR